MTPNRLLRWLPLLVMLALLAAALLPGCASKPDEPQFDNPFDPENPGSADPLHLQANYIIGTGDVFLNWDNRVDLGITSYQLFHSTDPDLIHSVPAFADTNAKADGSGMSYGYKSPVPSATNYFMVKAIRLLGDGTVEEPVTSQIVPASAAVPAVMANATGDYEVPTRFQQMTLAASWGDTAEIQLVYDPAVSWLAPLDEDGIAQFDLIDLQPAADDAKLKVFGRAFLNTGSSRFYTDGDTLTFTVDFAPIIKLPGNASTTATRIVDVQVTQHWQGVDSMRIANSRAELATAAWVPGDTMFFDHELPDQISLMTMFAEFAGDFGFAKIDTQNVSPDTLEDADFTLPDGYSTNDPLVLIRHTAKATHMKVALSDDFADAEWIPYEREMYLEIEGEPGIYLIQAQYRNDWTESPLRAHLLVYGGGDIQIAFTSPTNDGVVEGGQVYDVTGFTSQGHPDEPVTMVFFEAFGEWTEVEGTEFWEYPWDVPRVTEDTDLFVRARAYAERTQGNNTVVVDSATAIINVTISNLSVEITRPALGDTLFLDSRVSLRGTAQPYLLGAPLDSLKILTGTGQTLYPALPTGRDWTISWTTPTEYDNSSPTMTAWVYAGGDSTSHQVLYRLLENPEEE